MATRPTPIVVYSSFVDGDDRHNAASALAAGAIDVMAKPGPDDSARLEEYAEGLRRRLRVAGRVKVITHPRGRLGRTVSSVSTHRLAPVVGAQPGPPERTRDVQPACRPDWLETFAPRDLDLLAIGASTGGPQALATAARRPAGQDEHGDPRRAAHGRRVHGGPGHLAGRRLPAAGGARCHGKRLAPGVVTVAPSGAEPRGPRTAPRDDARAAARAVPRAGHRRDVRRPWRSAYGLVRRRCAAHRHGARRRARPASGSATVARSPSGRTSRPVRSTACRPRRCRAGRGRYPAAAAGDLLGGLPLLQTGEPRPTRRAES